jgi:glycosyltransferase involved in cell wall biosynthesis
MHKVLFIACSFSKGGPQALRFQRIIEFLKDDVEIHVLEIHHENETTIYENGYWKHSLEYSWAGKFLHSRFKLIDASGTVGKISTRFLKSRLKKSIRKRFFPDTFITEKGRLIKKAVWLINLHSYSTVVASGFPFTTMIISKTIKHYFPTVRFIYDIGDPFYNNSQNGFFRNWRAKIFERNYLKFVDKLVVTNNVTLQHYLNHFGDIIKPEQIEIVQQGVPFEFLSILDKPEVTRNIIRSGGELQLMYAGQLYLKLREPFQLYNSVIKWNKDDNQQKIRLDMYGAISDIFKISGQNESAINFKGRIGNSEVLAAYSNCDIIVFIDNAYGIQTPGKVFEVSAIGKPVLFISDHENSPAYEVVKDFKHIYFCNNKMNSIIEAIKAVNLVVDKELIQKVREQFSWRNRASQYFQLLTH